MIKQKRGSAWIWIVIILILIAVGVGIYFWLTGDGTGGSNGIFVESAIPQPPALPN